MNRRRPFVIGLTGSIGMGKSTTAAMFADAGIPVWDADEAVNRLYSKGGAAIAPMREVFPECVVDGKIDREILKQLILRDPNSLKQIETVVHPLVAEDRERFLSESTADIVLLDVPLLFESGAEAQTDIVVVVSVSAEIQRQRVMTRKGMSDQQLQTILANQMPDSEKRRRADEVVETLTLDATQHAVQKLLTQIRENLRNA